MADPPARILVVDDDRPMAELLRRILTNEGYEVDVAYEGQEAIEKSRKGNWSLVLMDVRLPGMDGYTICRTLRQNPSTHYLPILMLTSAGDIADKIAGFEAGADDFVTKPFQPKELVYRIGSLLARAAATHSNPPPSAAGKIIALFSSKGGVGKTTIATNLAVALRQQSNRRVALVDADFYFGGVGVHLNLPNVRTLLQLMAEMEGDDPSVVEKVMIPHPSGVRVLLSPFQPEEVDQVTTRHIEKVLDFLAQQYDFVVVDCQPSYDERMLKVLEKADEILLVVTPEVGPLKNTSLFLQWSHKLGYSQDKISVVLNRYNSNVGIGPEEIERTLQHEVTFRLISGGRPVVMSVNQGVPLVIEQPDHPFCMQVYRIADYYLERAQSGPADPRAYARA